MSDFAALAAKAASEETPAETFASGAAPAEDDDDAPVPEVKIRFYHVAIKTFHK